MDLITFSSFREQLKSIDLKNYNGSIIYVGKDSHHKCEYISGLWRLDYNRQTVLDTLSMLHKVKAYKYYAFDVFENRVCVHDRRGPHKYFHDIYKAFQYVIENEKRKMKMGFLL